MITDNYIKMCEQAEEIQKLKPYILTSTHLKGNIFICTDKDSTNYFWRMETLIDTGDEVGSSIYGPTKNIWLPTQEQLIKTHFDWYLQRYKGKMSISEYFLYLHEFALIAEESEYKYYTPKEMMMGYLYQEKYSKEWTGEKWEKIK